MYNDNDDLVRSTWDETLGVQNVLHQLIKTDADFSSEMGFKSVKQRCATNILCHKLFAARGSTTKEHPSISCLNHR
jgi:hypothetical protein